MAYIEWTKDLELGIKVIDDQHKRIIDYINDLDIAIGSNDKQKIIDVANRVVSYTLEHFSYEEALLRKANYMLTEPHIKVHEHFKEDVGIMHQNVSGESYISAAKAMRGELTIWLTNHIKREDADYAKAVGHLFNKKSFLNSFFNFFSGK